MKHKSRLNLAAVLIQALLLIMPASAFATAEAELEIGIPQPMESRAKGCFGVVLSPDGDGFYSVRDGLLTHYQIDPFKKIGSLVIDETQLKDIPEKTECRVLITDDGSKLILVFPEWIVSLDRSTGKIIKKQGREGALKRGRIEASTLNGNDLVILGAFSEGFRLTVLDASSLQFKMQISDLETTFKFLYTDTGCCFITKIQERLYLTSGRSLVVLNSKTYAPELTVSARASIGARISKDYRKLYLRPGRFVTDRLSHFEKDYGEAVENNTVLVFDQETRQIHFEETDSEKEQIEARLRDQYNPLLFTRNPSRNRDYVTFSQRGVAGIASRNADTKSLFYQYESGEAILIEKRPKGRLLPVWKFQLTPGARQYLMMKNSAGKVVPINDITFNQYLSTESRR